MAKDIYSMTVQEVVETGAEIHVHYHHTGNRRIAEDILSNFKPLGETEISETKAIRTGSARQRDVNVEVIAFYEVDEDE